MQPASGCMGAADEIVAVAVPANDPGASRPAGVERQKLSASGQRKALPAVNAVAKSMIEVKAALEASTRRKSRIAGLALEAKLLEMPDEGLKKQRQVQALLDRTQKLNQDEPEPRASSVVSLGGDESEGCERQDDE